MRRTIRVFSPGEPYRVVKPIPVYVERIEPTIWVATFVEANIAMAGKTQKEAIDGLRDVIVGTYESLFCEKFRNLGPEPTRKLQVLNQHMQKV